MSIIVIIIVLWNLFTFDPNSFSRPSVKNAKNTPGTFGIFHCRKRMCLAHSRASRSRVRQSISSRDCTLENSCPCTGIVFANSFIFLYNILIYHNVGDSVCQISLLRKYAVNITAWIFRTENPPRCRGGCKESEEFT